MADDFVRVDAQYGGLYRIRNTVTGDQYVGSARWFYMRRAQHWSGLRNGTHANVRLQRAWNRDGEAAFQFEVLAVLEPGERLAAEQRLLEQVCGRADYYNFRCDVRPPHEGRPHTPETRAKISALKRGKKRGPLSPEWRRALSESKKGQGVGIKRGPLTDEHKRKLSESTKGRPRPPEVVERLRLGQQRRRARERALREAA